ncbi:MAG TPA: anti-sigma factor [Bauldia sp.]|nr:anti-sigma factor [Bauldia sp.]
MAGIADDDALTAYLDGELDQATRAALEARMLSEPALKVRLDQLARGGRPFGAAYAALLAAAPEAQLQARLADVIAEHRASRGRGNWWRWAIAVAAAIVIFIAGGGAGYLLVPRLSPPAQPGWRQVVAEYQGLMTSETLAAIPDDRSVVAAEVSAAGGKLALALTPDKLALPDADLKRAEILDFRGKPLVQLAYLTPDSGPVALCIIANGRPDEAQAFEMREGFNIVFWTDNGRGYMLIGKAPRDRLEAYAETLAPKV